MSEERIWGLRVNCLEDHGRHSAALLGYGEGKCRSRDEAVSRLHLRLYEVADTGANALIADIRAMHQELERLREGLRGLAVAWADDAASWAEDDNVSGAYRECAGEIKALLKGTP